MMKKALSLFLAAAMCAGMLTGCGGGADTNDASNGDSGRYRERRSRRGRWRGI